MAATLQGTKKGRVYKDTKKTRMPELKLEDSDIKKRFQDKKKYLGSSLSVCLSGHRIVGYKVLGKNTCYKYISQCCSDYIVTIKLII